MHFIPPLRAGTLVRRYKRFLADITLDSGEEITAHCPNTGAMLGLTSPGTRVWVSWRDSQTRKYGYTWELAEKEGHYIGTNTRTPQDLCREAFEAGQIPEFRLYKTMKAEVSVGDSRLDFCLTDVNGSLGYCEVKNVHLLYHKTALFPDTITQRGTRHLQTLQRLAESGTAAFLLYVIQREDAEAFRVTGAIDPQYAKASVAAREAGVQFLAYTCQISPQSLTLDKSIPLQDPFYDPISEED